MSTIRMNNEHREFLFKLAKSSIACPAEEKADAAAYARGEKVARAIILKKYPAKEMEPLRKFDVAFHVFSAKFQLTAGGIEEFKFRGDKTGPLAPDRYSVHHAIYAADDSATAALQATLTAAAALKAARDKKLADYRALIWASATLDQIEGVWPEATALRERVGRALPVVLSDEVIARIKADVRPLKKAA